MIERRRRWQTLREGGAVAHFGIQTKVWLAVGTVLALFALACVGFSVAMREIAQVRAQYTAAFDTVVNIEDLTLEVLNQETGLRGYLLTSRDEYLLPYEQGELSFENHFRKLEIRFSDRPDQLVRLVQIRELMRQWRDNFAARVLSLHENPATREEGRLLLASGAGKARVDRMRAQLDAMIETEQKRLLEVETRLEQVMARVQRFALLTLALGLVIGLLALYLTSVLITRPILALTRVMTRLARGERNVAIGYQQRGDEIGSIARALDVFRGATAEIMRREWVKSRVAEMAGALSSQQGWLEFGNGLLDRLCPSVGAGYGTLYRYDDESNRLLPVGAYAGQAGFVSSRPLVPGEGLVGQCWRSAEPLLLDKVPDAYMRIGGGLGEASPRFVGFWPLHTPTGVVGVLELAAFSEFDDGETELIEEMLPIAALAMESLQNAIRTRRLLEQTSRQAEALRVSEERARHQATHDALTDLPNRALFMERLEQGIARAQRSGLTLALIYIDIDGFKPVNDQLGHPAGDELLIAIAGRLRGVIRRGDTACRLGGDEFALILEGMEDKGEAAERVAADVVALLSRPYTLSVNGEEREVEVGASVGVARLPMDAVELEALIHNADEAMYVAKRSGKNRYRLANRAD